MKTAVEDCRATDHLPLRFIFDGRAGSSMRDPSEASMYKSLLLQLVDRLSPADFMEVTATGFARRLKEDGSWCRTGIWEAMVDVLGRLSCTQLFIFIDAADECTDPNMSSLPHFLEDGLKGTNVNIRLCLSARTARSFNVAKSFSASNVARIDVASHNQADACSTRRAGHPAGQGLSRAA